MHQECLASKCDDTLLINDRESGNHTERLGSELSSILTGTGLDLKSLLEESAALLASAKKNNSEKSQENLQVLINKTNQPNIYEKISEIQKKIQTPVLSFRDSVKNFKALLGKKHENSCDQAAEKHFLCVNPTEIDLLECKESFLKREVQKQPMKSPILFKEKNRFFDLYYDKRSRKAHPFFVKKLDFLKEDPMIKIASNNSSANARRNILDQAQSFNLTNSKLQNKEEQNLFSNDIFSFNFMGISESDTHASEIASLPLPSNRETPFQSNFSANLEPEASENEKKNDQPDHGYLGGPPGLFRKGDWPCSKCRNVNFGRRLICFRCGEEKPEEYVKESEEFFKERREEREKLRNPGGKPIIKRRKIKRIEDIKREIERQLSKFSDIEPEQNEENTVDKGCPMEKPNFPEEEKVNSYQSSAERKSHDSGEKKYDAFLQTWERELRNNFVTSDRSGQEKIDYGALYNEWEKKFEREGFSDKFSEDSGDAFMSNSMKKKKRQGSSFKKSIFESWKKDFSRRLEESFVNEKKDFRRSRSPSPERYGKIDRFNSG